MHAHPPSPSLSTPPPPRQASRALENVRELFARHPRVGGTPSTGHPRVVEKDPRVILGSSSGHPRVIRRSVATRLRPGCDSVATRLRVNGGRSRGRCRGSGKSCGRVATQLRVGCDSVARLNILLNPPQPATIPSQRPGKILEAVCNGLETALQPPGKLDFAIRKPCHRVARAAWFREPQPHTSFSLLHVPVPSALLSSLSSLDEPFAMMNPLALVS